MKLRFASMLCVGVMLLSHAVAHAQAPAASPVGDWQSSSLPVPSGAGGAYTTFPITVRLTISSIGADQSAAGTFRVLVPFGAGASSMCVNGPVTGRFDGVALNVVSDASNLCDARRFELKFDGSQMAGIYVGTSGIPQEVTFSRR